MKKFVGKRVTRKPWSSGCRQPRYLIHSVECLSGANFVRPGFPTPLLTPVRLHWDSSGPVPSLLRRNKKVSAPYGTFPWLRTHNPNLIHSPLKIEKTTSFWTELSNGDDRVEITHPLFLSRSCIKGTLFEGNTRGYKNLVTRGAPILTLVNTRYKQVCIVYSRFLPSQCLFAPQSPLYFTYGFLRLKDGQRRESSWKNL